MMSGWYLAPCLVVLREEIDARWPHRDRTSDGTIGDSAHQARTSDHNPDRDSSVNALDVDADGVHMPTILAAVERHPSAHYWIWQRQIADRDDGWRPRTYTGSNPHTAHIHISIRHGQAAEQDRRPWGISEDSMTPEELARADIWTNPYGDAARNEHISLNTFVRNAGSDTRETVEQVRAVRWDLDAVRTRLDELANRPAPGPIDYDALAVALLRRIAAS